MRGRGGTARRRRQEPRRGGRRRRRLPARRRRPRPGLPPGDQPPRVGASGPELRRGRRGRPGAGPAVLLAVRVAGVAPRPPRVVPRAGRGGSHEVLLVGAPVGLVRGDPHVVRDTQAGVRDGPGRGAPRGDHVRADAQEAGAAAHEAAAEDREGGEREEARPGPHGRGVVRRGRGDELGRRPLRPARPRPRADLLHRAADHRAAPPPQRRRGGHRDRRRGAALGGHRGAVVVERRADALGEEGRRLRRGDHGEGD
mmetsp:Transcript_3900/g.8750  ORF Transcript_3900/g.8750 Transcript_3900/m.8750 type:complete len:255 (+) Transcript_3900:353-1117(+)